MKALIDGDVIVYQGGFASDQTSYTCADGFTCKYKKDANQHCKDNNLAIPTIEKHVEAEPVQYCLSSIKKMIKGIVEATDADEYLVLLSGQGNFRSKIYKEYKANRDRTHRPTHYDAIREYLLNFHHADEVIGVEADDAMGWHQYKDMLLHKSDQLDSETVICTVDKDLNQIPGWHYNWRTDDGQGAMYWVAPVEATEFFFEQWLTGDSADNIPGIRKVGPVTAAKMIDQFLGTFQYRDPTPQEFYNFIMNKWAFGMPHASAKFVHMIGDLLWMQRRPGDTWDIHFGLTKERTKNEQDEVESK